MLTLVRAVQYEVIDDVQAVVCLAGHLEDSQELAYLLERLVAALPYATNQFDQLVGMKISTRDGNVLHQSSVGNERTETSWYQSEAAKCFEAVRPHLEFRIIFRRSSSLFLLQRRKLPSVYQRQLWTCFTHR